MDERDGTIAAREHGLNVAGTPGVPDRAAPRRWIALSIMFQRLTQTTFRSPKRLMATLPEQDAARRMTAPLPPAPLG
jgi:predicted nucleic acid-binding protein